MAYVLIATVAAALGIVAYFIIYRKKKKKELYEKEAKRILAEKYLDNLLMQRKSARGGRQLMVRLKVENEHPEKVHIFDPSAQIIIGRSRKGVTFQLRDRKISARHCRIYEIRGELYLEDLSSSNGTALQRGRTPSVWLFPGRPCRIYEDDRIFLGSTWLQVKPFYVIGESV